MSYTLQEFYAKVREQSRTLRCVLCDAAPGEACRTRTGNPVQFDHSKRRLRGRYLAEQYYINQRKLTNAIRDL